MKSNYSLNDTIQIGKYKTEIRSLTEDTQYFLYSTIESAPYLEDIYRQFGLKSEDITNIYGYNDGGGFPFARSLNDLNKVINYLLSFDNQYKPGDTLQIGKRQVEVYKYSDNQYYLHIHNHFSNAAIYEQFNLTRHHIQSIYGYTSNGDFPLAKSIEDLNKAIQYLLNLEKSFKNTSYRIDKTVNNEIIQITKLSTGEQFTKGDYLYH
jgi:uncharacterized FlaG/YvyC family protein